VVRVTPSATPTVTASSTPVPLAATPVAPAQTATSLSSAVSSLLGDWSFQAETGERDIAGALRFQVEGAELAGLFIGQRGNATALANLRLAGNQISWDLVAVRGTYHLEGTVSGSSMSGTFRTITRTVNWTAVKEGATALPAATPTPR